MQHRQHILGNDVADIFQVIGNTDEPGKVLRLLADELPLRQVAKEYDDLLVKRINFVVGLFQRSCVLFRAVHCRV